MPKKKNSRAAAGAGSIRQRPDGRWEGRISLGAHPGTGKPLRRSFYADTQADVVKQMQQAQAAVNTGTYTEPTKMTLGAWLDVWTKEYLGSKKEATQAKI